ncbi:hypothetical protein AAG906_038869 [Vitis piasezkii]
MDESRSPYFLHNGDHSGLDLVSHHLMGNNNNTWSRAMSMALNVKNKLGFIDDIISQPSTIAILFDTCKEIVNNSLYIDIVVEVW